MNTEKKELIQTIQDLIQKPGGKQAARFLLNSLGGVPIAGGVFAAVSAVWSEKDQQKFNQAIAAWAGKTNDEMNQVLSHVKEVLKTPTKARMTLLVGEILGEELANQLLSNPNQKIGVMLNGETVTELQPFIKKGWITLSSTGGMTNLGAGNQVGNHLEELKRPWGFGSGFILQITNQFFDSEE